MREEVGVEDGGWGGMGVGGEGGHITSCKASHRNPRTDFHASFHTWYLNSFRLNVNTFPYTGLTIQIN